MKSPNSLYRTYRQNLTARQMLRAAIRVWRLNPDTKVAERAFARAIERLYEETGDCTVQMGVDEVSCPLEYLEECLRTLEA